MHVSMRGHLKVLIVVSLMFTFGLVDAGAATRKRRRHRAARRPAAAKPVITNPTIAPPATTQHAAGDVKVISTADQETTASDESTETVQPKKSKTKSDQNEDIQQTITTLSNQVNKLTDKLTQMQQDDRYMMDMERLTRAEQRAEQLRSQLIDVQSKTADLQSHLEQTEYSLKPENIEKATQVYGTVHPEEARDSRRRQLESEKARVQAQLNILETSSTRLQQAITTADAEVDLLRARLNQQRDQDSTAPKTEARPVRSRPPR